MNELDYRISTDNETGRRSIERVPDLQTPISLQSLEDAFRQVESDFNRVSQPKNTIQNKVISYKKYLTKWQMMRGMIAQLIDGSSLSDRQCKWMETNHKGGHKGLLSDMESEDNAVLLLNYCNKMILLCED